ncbi:GTP pyrophosphokinase rsh [compost metagenome]
MFVNLSEAGVVLVARAELYATEKHAGQMYGEYPYTYHLEKVALNVALRNKDHQLLSTLVAVAWLHDVMEDCGVTYEELVREFGVCIASSVRALTKVKGRSYQEYLEDCMQYAIAHEVKICDTFANLTESIFTRNEKGMKKYPRQLAILINGEYYE